jgi:hypothetical protein
MDAYINIQKLDLKESQQRDIVRVCVQCTMSEKVYNPYYTLVLLQFIKQSHSHAVTFKYTLWDALKSFITDDRDDDHNHRCERMAVLTSDLVLNGGIHLSVLKVYHILKKTVEWTNKQHLKFAKSIVTNLVSRSSEGEYLKVWKGFNEDVWVQGFMFFMRETFLSGCRDLNIRGRVRAVLNSLDDRKHQDL